MLILPVHKRLTRQNFPIVTLVLIAINIWVFFFLQVPDAVRRVTAHEFYLQSDLKSIELPLFPDYLTQTQGRAARDFIRENTEPDELLPLIDAHPEFRAWVPNHIPIEQIDDWQSVRTQYEALRGNPFTDRYYLQFNSVRPVSLLSHMFLHGGIGHLFGNMLFLFFLGLLVEGATGRRLFLASYLLAGFGATVASLAVHWGSIGGSLGASGAIAGLMGLYTVLYGRRKVRFFYWAFIYFDYVKKPAIWLLPAWLGWSFLQFFLDSAGNVAYEAHIGGIVTGVLLALGILQLRWQNSEFLDEESNRDADSALYQQALADLEALQIDQAKTKLKELLPRHGDDFRFLKQFHRACQIRPKDPDLPDAMVRLLEWPAYRDDEQDYVHKAFQRFLNEPRLLPGLSVDAAARTAKRFAHQGHLREARALVHWLWQHPASEPVRSATLVLGRACVSQEQVDLAGRYLNWVVQNGPTDALSHEAQTLLP